MCLTSIIAADKLIGNSKGHLVALWLKQTKYTESINPNWETVPYAAPLFPIVCLNCDLLIQDEKVKICRIYWPFYLVEEAVFSRQISIKAWLPPAGKCLLLSGPAVKLPGTLWCRCTWATRVANKLWMLIPTLGPCIMSTAVYKSPHAIMYDL